MSYDLFEDIFIQLLNKHAPQKILLRGNHQPFVSKNYQRQL